MSSKSIVFVDSRVANYQSLIDSLTEPYDVFVLDGDKDGLDQMAGYLKGRIGLDAIHVISHGSRGTLYLGSAVLDNSNLLSYGTQLGSIGSSLTQTGDILLYGCDVAQGYAGLAFIQALAGSTGADVAASTDATGSFALGGDWVLELATGPIEAPRIATLTYTNLLAVIDGTSLPDTLLGTSDNDTINGLGGNDTIDGQAGSDSLSGGDGDDRIEGNFGNDSLYGGNGNDTLTDDQGSNLLDGGAGVDILTSRSLSGQHTLLGGAGNDTLNATGAIVNLDGGDQDDYLFAAGQLFQGGSTSNVQNGTATLAGGFGDDNLNVSEYTTSSLDGGDGNDRLAVNGYFSGSYFSTNYSSSSYQTFGTQPLTTVLTGGAGDDWLGAAFVSQANLSGGDGVDSLTVSNVRSATLVGGAGIDTLTVNSYQSSQNTDGDARLNKTYSLDGGDDNDILNVSSNNYIGSGQTSVALLGGLGNDRLSVTDSMAGDTGNQGQNYGVAIANLNGGDGDDILSVGGVLKATLTGGAGADAFMLTAQQYRTLLEGTRAFAQTNGTNAAVTADPVIITDFTVGVGGDVLDYSDLLRNGALTYDGSNPFSTGYLKLEQSGANTLVLFDADGTAGAAETPVALAVLQNVSASTLAASNFNPNYPPDGSAAVAQTLTGSSLSETLIGGFGNDTINGLGGNDTIDGQAGSDSLSGGDGDDRIEGNFGNDSLYGGNGNDTLTDDQGSNLLDGGAGVDILTSRSLSGQHTLLGGAGNDTLNATGAIVNLDGGDQDDYLFAAGQLFQGGSTSNVQNGTATLAGGFGDDNLNVSEYTTSSLDGGDGNDRLAVNGYFSGSYFSTNYSSSSYQTFGTQPLTTVLTGGAGDDWLGAAFVSQANLSGGDGVDSLTVSNVRSATLVGGAGIDTLTVNSYQSSQNTDGDARLNKTYSLDGGDDNDILNVSSNNYIGSGQTSVALLGGLGNDRLSVTDSMAGDTGNQGQNYGVAIANLNGGDGDDILSVGGVLKATLTGGAGADAFMLTAQQYRTLLEGTRAFAQTNGTNAAVTADPVIITDFTVGVGGDVLDYSDLLRNGALTYDGSNPFSTGYLKLEQSGANTLVLFDADGTAGAAETPVALAVLQNVSASTLAASNFNPNYPPDGSMTITPTAGNDSLTGTSGNDTLTGLGGDDTLTGGLGNDSLDGGDGIDTASYASATAGISLNLGLASAQVTAGAGTDTLLNIENLIGGNFNDVFTGTSAANRLEGGLGNDILQGAAGNDIVDAGDGDDEIVGGDGAGNDTYIGGAGIDTVRYTSAITGITVNLTLGTASGNEIGNDTLTGIENILGGQAGDILQGDGQANLIDGHTGNDTLNGGDGNDQLNGNNGHDTLSGGTGSDTLSGGAGDDSLIGGSDLDYADYSGAITGVTVNLSTGRAIGADGHDILSGIEGIVGSAFADRLTGDASDNILRGIAGEDTLDGGAGGDTADYSSASGAVNANLNTRSSSGADGNDLFINIENLTGSSHGDTLTGSTGANVLRGLAGNDTLTGDAGADRFVYGATGNGLDTITDLGADDQIVIQSALAALAVVGGDGSAVTGTRVQAISSGGVTTLSVDTNNSVGADIQILISGTYAPGSFSVTNNGDGTSTIARSSAGTNLIGSAGADTLIGTPDGDNLSTLGGNDTLFGGTGNDMLDGGSGIDMLYGGTGDDTFVIDTQSDLAFEAASEGTDTVLSSASFYLYNNIENLTLTGVALYGVGNNLDNIITGNAQENLLIGWDGNDVIAAGDARDAIYGVNGNDVIYADAGIDYVVGGLGNDTIYGGLDADEIYGQEGNDALYGGEDFATDILVGGDGNDTLDGGAAWDLMYGNAGDDTYYVSQQVDWIFESAGEGYDTVYADSPNGFYLYFNTEALILLGSTPFGVGNAENNVITGNAIGNTVLGGAGNDTLDGAAGLDILWGQAGGDTFVFKRGTQTDIVGDFNVGQDKLHISDYGFATVGAAKAAMTQVGVDIVFNLGGGDLVILQAVGINTLTSAEFVL
jgi:Ca2+-binding RTX toxin-like protein